MPSKKKKMNSEESKLSKQYQSMTALEHIEKKPDTYIGAIEEGRIADFGNERVIQTQGFEKSQFHAIAGERDTVQLSYVDQRVNPTEY